MEHKRTGLILFGILWIAIGLLLGMMTLFMLAAVVAGPSAAAPGAPTPRMMAAIGVMYLGIGACFAALGIGSIMAKRWARALILALSWMWMIVGVLTCVMLAFTLPMTLRTLPREQAAAMPVIVGCVVAMVAIFFVLLPGMSILFYRRPKVRAAVEAFDPVHRWTDDVPLPLLAYGVLMIGGAAMVILSAFMLPVLPLGPWMLRGAAMIAFVGVMSLLLFFIGFGMLRRRMAAWWAALVMLILGMGVTMLMSKVDWRAYYDEMGMAMQPAQVEMMERMYSPPGIFIWTGILWGFYIAFLLFLRRYFVREGVNT